MREISDYTVRRRRGRPLEKQTGRFLMRAFSTSGRPRRTRARTKLESAAGRAASDNDNPLVFLGFLLIGTFRQSDSQLQSKSSSVFFFLWHLPLPILRLVSGVLSPRLPSLLRPSPVYSLPPSHYVTHSEESSLSSFSSPKNAFKTFSLEAGGGPRPPAPLLSARLGRPLLFTSLSRCSDPSSFCSFSDIVRRFT